MIEYRYSFVNYSLIWKISAIILQSSQRYEFEKYFFCIFGYDKINDVVGLKKV